MNKKHIIYIASIICLLLPNSLYGNEIRTEIVNGRTITEVFHAPSSDIQWYEYKVDNYSQQIDSIKQSKMPFSYHTKYPVWNYPYIHNAVQEFKKYIKNIFTDNGAVQSNEEYLQNCRYLINDTGEVFCYEIWTARSLFFIYTPAEILEIFDEISTYVFPTPVVKVPEDGVGYEILDMLF